jgi:diamine N-acetyltransferase
MNKTLTDINIRRCNSRDAQELADLGRITFRETFEAVNTAENMRLYLSKTFSIENILNELKETGVSFYIAESAGKSLGFCKIKSPSPHPDLSGVRPMEIERIYALKEHIGKGVGKALIEYCHQYAHANGYDLIWLGVWEHNHPAITFYRKWGFDFFGKHVFMLGNDAQTDLLMKKNLK